MTEPRWYLLIHQIPPKPLYLRAKIRQRLGKVGAVAIKNSVYVLPRTDTCLEDLQWIAQEVVTGGGEASVSEASFVFGITNEDLVKRFRDQRDAEYASLSAEVEEALSALRHRGGAKPPEAEAAVRSERLRKRFAEIEDVDFFRSAGRKETAAALDRLERALQPKGRRPAERRVSHAHLVGKTWVTRRGIQVDRIASAWLVRRFIDEDARFRFSDPKEIRPADGEIRFDTMPGEITHEGDRCTFETLIAAAAITDPAIREIAEIVHDIDLKDGKFGRGDAAGVQRLVVGLVLSLAEDEARLARGFALFDDLYRSFSRAAGMGGTPPRKSASAGGTR